MGHTNRATARFFVDIGTDDFADRKFAGILPFHPVIKKGRGSKPAGFGAAGSKWQEVFGKSEKKGLLPMIGPSLKMMRCAKMSMKIFVENKIKYIGIISFEIGSRCGTPATRGSRMYASFQKSAYHTCRCPAAAFSRYFSVTYLQLAGYPPDYVYDRIRANKKKKFFNMKSIRFV